MANTEGRVFWRDGGSLLEPVFTDALRAERSKFTFIDLFAGIGGFRIPLAEIGGECLFSSEIDRHARTTYNEWFGEEPFGDITSIPITEIPDHDVLAAGFPCQPFSLAGVSKKKSLGRPHGFSCQTQGTLFFNVASIIEAKKPPIVLLENVKNLRSHDGGRTWSVIKQTLENLGYAVFSKVIDAVNYVPQHRERIYVVGLKTAQFGTSPDFSFSDIPPNRSHAVKTILEKTVDKKYTLSDHLWNYLRQYAEKHRSKGNGFGYGLVDLGGTTRTLSARYYKDGSEILIPQKGRNPRRLTPRECARLMGFPDEFPIVVSDTQAYRQFGNAIVPPVARVVVNDIRPLLIDYLSKAKPKTRRRRAA